MDPSNHSQQHQSLLLLAIAMENATSFQDLGAIRRHNSPLALTIAVLLVFLFSPMILMGNSLILIAVYRFKRLRTPSNLLVVSLAISDLAVGIFMPIGIYVEIGAVNATVCLFNYGVAITLCSVSVLVTVAIAVDRFASLAQPLRYPNLITNTAIERYIFVFWAYASLVGFTPLMYFLVNSGKYATTDIECSFNLISRPVQLFMFCAVYAPSCLILIGCYSYVYFVARLHARAISLHNNGQNCARYGLALATTAGLFILLWTPFLICMLLDVFFNTNILTGWKTLYLSLPILAHSVFNPWIYGYRNSELRLAVFRVVDDLLTAVGLTYRSNQTTQTVVNVNGSVQATVGNEASFIQHVQRECFSFKPSCDFLLVPIARAESSGLIDDSETNNATAPTHFIISTRDRPRILRTSISMVESLAVFKGSDVFIVTGLTRGMTHGASVV